LGVYAVLERSAADRTEPCHCGLPDIGANIVLKLRTSVLC